MHCTETETRKARKTHLCMSCGELVNVGDEYKRWRCYDSGDVGTVKMHPECYAAMQDAAQDNGGDIEFTPGEHSRGSIGETA